MRNKRTDNKGSTMIFLVIAMALVIVLGATVLNVVNRQYEIKKFNTATKQCFYMAETGLNEAYVKSCILMDEAVSKALTMAEKYLAAYPMAITEAESIFSENFKLYITSNIRNRINIAENPSIEIRNEGSLLFVNNALTLLLKSSYINEINVEKIVWVRIVITIPEFNDVKNNLYKTNDYIKLQNWKS